MMVSVRLLQGVRGPSAFVSTFALVAAACGAPPAAQPPTPTTATPCPTVMPVSAPGTTVQAQAPADAGGGAAEPATSDAGSAAKQTPHETFVITSKAVGEDRKIHLYTPPASLPRGDSLPVLYLLDGGDDEDFPHPGVMAAVDLAIRAGEMRPIVVVGIENTERRRDMTGPTEVEKDRTIAPRVGGSAAFRRFLRDELMPEVKKRVPGSGKTAIAGESLAGLFVLETFFLEPALFDTYISISPSLWWNDKALVRGAAAWFKAHPRLSNTLYVARAGDDDIADANSSFGTILRTHAPASKGLTWFFEPRADLRHSNIYEAVAPALVRRLWPPLSK